MSDNIKNKLPLFYNIDSKTTYIRQNNFLICPVSNKKIPITNNIPRFEALNNYSDAFGFQWNRFRKTQLDSYSHTGISFDRMKLSLGEEIWNKLRDLTVLEAGCGSGRFTEVILQQGADIVSIDLSSAVEANQNNFPISEHHIIAQADIGKIPFAPQSFDLVICLGVVQHTASPEQTITALLDQVKPNDWLVFDHYRKSEGWRKFASPKRLYRAILKRCSPKTSMRIIELFVKILFPIHQNTEYKFLKSLLLISPLITYFDSYPQLNESQQREWALLDTYDSLTDYYKHFRTKEQLFKFVESLDVKNIYCEYGGTGVVVRCQRNS